MNFTTLIMLIFTAILAIGLVSKGLNSIIVWSSQRVLCDYQSISMLPAVAETETSR